jgi:hypothetical protein
VSHIWSASIITGFAIVLTGAIAFQTAQAKTAQTAATGTRALQSENAQLIQRLNRLEALMLDTRRACGGGEEVSAPAPLTEAERELLRMKARDLKNERSTSTEDAVTSTKKQF